MPSIPQTCAKVRAVKAFKKAHPEYSHGVHCYKNRRMQIIRVIGYTPDDKRAYCAVWSYADNGYLQKVSA